MVKTKRVWGWWSRAEGGKTRESGKVYWKRKREQEKERKGSVCERVCKEWKMGVKWSEVKVKEDLLNWDGKLKRLEFWVPIFRERQWEWTAFHHAS